MPGVDGGHGAAGPILCDGTRAVKVGPGGALRLVRSAHPPGAGASYDEGAGKKEDSMEPLQIHWLDMPKSDAVETKIRERADLLSRFSEDVLKCEVWVVSPHGHHRKGPLYEVRIRMTVPGEEIDVNLQPGSDDVYVRGAFDALRRKLEDYERRRRGRVKAHPREKSDRSRRRQIPPRGERV